jgi:hypothetical protein
MVKWKFDHGVRDSDWPACRRQIDVLPPTVRRNARPCEQGFDARDALRRNRTREGRERVPDVAIFTVRKHLQPPTPGEGFDRLYAVTMIEAERRFNVEPIQ